MDEPDTQEALLEVFVFETYQNAEHLESMVLDAEENGHFTTAQIQEIFRIMHTLKGSAAMMGYHSLTELAHGMEDLFQYLRDEPATLGPCPKELSDLLFNSLDFIRGELSKAESGAKPDGDPKVQIIAIRGYLERLTSASHEVLHLSTQTEALKHFLARVEFEEESEMEHARALLLVRAMQEQVVALTFSPEDLADSRSALIIRDHGLHLEFYSAEPEEQLVRYLSQTSGVHNVEVRLTEPASEGGAHPDKVDGPSPALSASEFPHAEGHPDYLQGTHNHTSSHAFINVPTEKLDKVIDLIGEIVVSESMIAHAPELQQRHGDGLIRATQQLSKVTSELQDVAMSLRMVPLATIFGRIKRVVRDMSQHLNKPVSLEVIGEDVDVDKNIVEHISDPLLHLVRNAVDHGIESSAKRQQRGKSTTGKITVEARNAGGDVLISVRDDGMGINKANVVETAKKRGLLPDGETELSDRQIYSLILSPGFSTARTVTEYSGRGVGMDVVAKNVEAIGGTILVESEEGIGTQITLKIPLTLAIIDGMNIRVGKSVYTIPTTAIRESFRPRKEDVVVDPDNQELLMLRGVCYPVVRLHEVYQVKPLHTVLNEGIVVFIEDDESGFCLFADELIGKQQVVVKSLPTYLDRIGKMKGLSGCALLGDGSISFILNPLSLYA